MAALILDLKRKWASPRLRQWLRSQELLVLVGVLVYLVLWAYECKRHSWRSW